jgi:hypothetical protein
MVLLIVHNPLFWAIDSDWVASSRHQSRAHGQRRFMVEVPPLLAFAPWKTTILNRCHRFRGFVYEHARSSTDEKSIEVVLRPRKGSAAICSPIKPGNCKILIFTAFADTANYLYEHLAGSLLMHRDCVHVSVHLRPGRGHFDLPNWKPLASKKRLEYSTGYYKMRVRGTPIRLYESLQNEMV